jgi:hypothetical protein
LFPIFKGDWWQGLQGLRQFSFEPLNRGSELSLRFTNFDLLFEEDEIIEDDEMTEDCLKN